MEFLCIGLSHKSAPVEIREKLALPVSEQERLLRAIGEGGTEAMLVSTCNRAEFYVACPSAEAFKALLLAVISNVGGQDSLAHLYEHRADAALVHLFRVAASLDSMILGEAQILGQVKEAFDLARQVGTARGELTRVCSAAFASAKRVRSETDLGRAAVSMASVAVELAEKIFGGLGGRTALMLGAGEMAELAVRHLRSSGCAVTIINRTRANAEALASELGAEARPFDQLASLLVWADIVVCSTASPAPLLTPENMAPVLKARKFRPLFMVDLAVPRDIDPAVHQLAGVYAYNVDDMERVVSDNVAARGSQAAKAEAIIAEEIARFVRERSIRDGVPVLAQLRARAEEIALAEVQKTLGHLEGLTDKQRKSIEAMAMAIVNKLLHQPTAKLRASAPQTGPHPLAGAAAELFGLEAPSATTWQAKPPPDAPPADTHVGKGSKP